MKIEFKPIGVIRTDTKTVPRHWSVSEVEGKIVLDEKYTAGMKDIKHGQRIVVIFYFHKSPGFSESFLIQKPPHRQQNLGVFSTCSPIRPNPVGMSIVEVMRVEKNIIFVKGLDMIDGTPVLDIKPYIEIDTNKLTDNK
jgi:tRNA-Thr(GGU) m(6)t(6)A37 methyltransferase TsaA